MRGDDKYIDDFYNRSQDAGFAPQFCFTVDLAHYSRRERDVVKRHDRIANRSATSIAISPDSTGARSSASRSAIPKAQIIIKGIQTAEDAQLCLDNGIAGIYVTNHGGRALDHARGAMDILPEVVEVVKGKVPVIIDGAFYRATDVLKAIALGATAVGIGRLYCYALAAAGRPGIVRMLELLEDEMRRDLGLMGCDSVKKLDKSYVCPAAPVRTADVFSAYHLGDYQARPVLIGGRHARDQDLQPRHARQAARAVLADHAREGVRVRVHRRTGRGGSRRQGGRAISTRNAPWSMPISRPR